MKKLGAAMDLHRRRRRDLDEESALVVVGSFFGILAFVGGRRQRPALGLVWCGRWDDGERYLGGLVGIHDGDGVHWRLGLGKGEIR